MSRLLDLAQGLGSLSGDTLWEIFNSSLSDRKKEIKDLIEKKIIENGGWNVKDEISGVEIVGEKEKIPIRTPKKQLASDCEFAIDAMDYELLIKTSKGWQRTDYLIKTIKTKE